LQKLVITTAVLKLQTDYYRSESTVQQLAA
jgi:hypothetical protein